MDPVDRRQMFLRWILKILVSLVGLKVLAILGDHEAQGVPAQIHLVVQGDLVVLLALVDLTASEMPVMRLLS